MTKFSTFLLALTTTIGPASATPLYPREDKVINFDGRFEVTLINMCDDECLAEHKHDWSISQEIPNAGGVMAQTSMDNYPGQTGHGGDIYHVVGKIAFTSAADKGSNKDNGHVFFVDRPPTKSERQAIAEHRVDAQDRNWRVSCCSSSDCSPADTSSSALSPSTTKVLSWR